MCRSVNKKKYNICELLTENLLLMLSATIVVLEYAAL